MIFKKKDIFLFFSIKKFIIFSFNWKPNQTRWLRKFVNRIQMVLRQSLIFPSLETHGIAPGGPILGQDTEWAKESHIPTKKFEMCGMAFLFTHLLSQFLFLFLYSSPPFCPLDSRWKPRVQFNFLWVNSLSDSFLTWSSQPCTESSRLSCSSCSRCRPALHHSRNIWGRSCASICQVHARRISPRFYLLGIFTWAHEGETREREEKGWNQLFVLYYTPGIIYRII